MLELPVVLQAIKEAEQMMNANEFEINATQVMSLISGSSCSAYDCEFVALLTESPFIGRHVKGREDRVFVKDHYQISYLNNEDYIRVLHCWDRRRNPGGLDF